MPAVNKQEENLIELKGQNFARSNRTLRTLKMGQPIHPECQWPRTERWWVRCEEAGHEPYITKQEREFSIPVYETDEDGDMVLKETKTKRKVIVRPNIVQVALDDDHNDGRGPEKFAKTKGFRQLEELGYMPMCQLYDCWMPSTVKCEFGEFCSKEHARMVGALAEGVALEVLDRRKRRAQLRAVELD